MEKKIRRNCKARKEIRKRRRSRKCFEKDVEKARRSESKGRSKILEEMECAKII